MIAKKDQETSAKATKALAGAITNGDLDMCRRLINDGATINQSIDGSEGCTLFVSALAQSSIAIASLLLDAGVDVKGQLCPKHPLRHYTAVHIAAKFGFDGILQRLLELDPPKLGEFPLDPIHIAAAEDQLPSLQLLLEHRPLSTKTSTPQEINRCAATEDDTGSRGVVADRLEVRSGPQPFGEWPLGSYFPAFRTQELATPLHVASLYGRTRIVQHLIQKGANVDARDIFFSTPLHYAAATGQTVVLSILTDAGASLGCRTSDGFSLAMVAARWGKVEFLEELNMRGADCDEATDLYGRDAMMLALMSGRLCVVPTLLASGYSFSRTTSFGETALRTGLLSKNPLVRDFVMSHAPPEVDQCDFVYGNLVILACTKFAPLPILRWVVNRIPHELKGYQLNFESPRFGTPLYIVAHRGFYPSVSFLLHHGAIVDKKGGPLGTPLMAACAMGRVDVVELLVQKSAGLITWDDDGNNNSAWDHSKHQKRILKYLDSHAG